MPVAAPTKVLVRDVITMALHKFKFTDRLEVGITLVDNPGIQQLNLEYRGIDAPTDVLSFALQESREAGEIPFADASGTLLLGDIVISCEQAAAQAAEYGHSFEREMGFLTAHGILHLLGYDHRTDAEAKEMRALEEEILVSLKLTRDNSVRRTLF